MRAGVNTAESTLRVDVDLLNRMMNLVELVLTRNQILQMVSTDANLTVPRVAWTWLLICAKQS